MALINFMSTCVCHVELFSWPSTAVKCQCSLCREEVVSLVAKQQSFGNTEPQTIACVHERRHQALHQKPLRPPVQHLAETTAALHSFQLKWTLIKLLFDALITSSSLLSCRANFRTAPHTSTPDMHSLIISFYECWSETKGKRKVMTYF